MAGEWSEVVLSDVIEVKHGFAFPGENIREEPPGDILLTPGNFAIGGGFKGDKFKYFDGLTPEDYVLRENDLVVTMTDLSKQADTLGYPALVPKLRGARFLHNQRVGKIIIRANAELDKQFLFYLLRTPEYRHEVLASATGTTVKHTSPTRILAYKATLPPLPEQHAIAHILGTLDDKIELNRKMKETLEAMARAIFKSWFVDAVIKGIPKGWRECKWGDLVTLEYGKSLSDYETEKGAYPVFGTNGRIGTCSEPLCQHPGVIIGRKGAYRGVHFSNSSFFVIDTAFYVEPKTALEMRWVYYELLRQDINSMDSGSAIPSTSREDFYSLSVLVPPFEMQQRFVQLLNPLWDRQDQNDKESVTLAVIRDTLLPKLLSEKLRVRNVEELFA